MRDGGTAGSTNVEDLGTRLHVDVVKTTQDTGSQLGTEGVPHTVLSLGDNTIITSGGLDRDALLAVNSLTGGQVLGDEQILLTTTGNEDTSVTVVLLFEGEESSGSAIENLPEPLKIRILKYSQ